MLDSILNTIKKMLNIPPEDTSFDTDILVYINSALSALFQIGVGPDEPFIVVDPNTEWSSLTTDVRVLSLAKSYIYYSVRLSFDPPATSFVIESYNKVMLETLWRLNELANPYVPPPVEPEEL